VRDRRAQRTGVTSGNMCAQLSDYIGQVFECKAESPYYSRRGTAHSYKWGASRAIRSSKFWIRSSENLELRTSNPRSSHTPRLTQARRAGKARRARVDLVCLVCLVQPNRRERPDKQERPAGPRACRAPLRHFATNRHEQCGLSSCTKLLHSLTSRTPSHNIEKCHASKCAKP
jgi:hypothetical protein